LKEKENGHISNFLSETIHLAGHFYPEVGRAMEDEFADLLDRLGYSVLRKRDIKSGLDIIANFVGEPAKPKFSNKCILRKPSFAPKNTTAFSLKREDFTEADVSELVEKTQKAKNSDDEVLKSIEGAIIVTNYTKTEDELDKLLSKSVYCWDGRRLIFYAAKARTISDLAFKGPVEEVVIESFGNATYIIQKETLPRAILTNVAVFIDDHNKKLMVSYDHIKNILTYVYDHSFKKIVESTQLDVQALFKIHVLGIAEKALVEKAYIDYAVKEESAHPQVVFSAVPTIFQYGSAPWTALLQL
jgi:hypothetical protein